jgi:hypothetical protein
LRINAISSQAFSPVVISSPAWGGSFSEIDSLGFLFPPNMNQHDAFFDARGRLSNLSHPFQPFEHLAVNSVNEIARERSLAWGR